MSDGKLTKAQRRVLAGYYRAQRETLASEIWTYVPNYGSRGRSYYGIVDKLIRRGYISRPQTVQMSATWWIALNIVTPKGRAALGEAQP